MKLSDLDPPTRGVTGFECGFAVLHDLLDADDKVTLAKWLNDPHVSDAQVAERLSLIGPRPINHQAVLRHRRGQCVRCATAGRVWTDG